MPFAAALSEHPLATQATGEVLGQILERVGEAPDLAVLFVTGPHVGALEDIAAAVQSVLRPGAFVGASAASVLGGDREVETQPAIVLWVARFGAVAATHVDAVRTGSGVALHGLDAAQLDGASTMLLLADPASFPIEEVLREHRSSHPDLVVVGGLASSGAAAGQNRLVVGGRVHDHGAAAVLLGPGQPVTAFVSQGCRPLGEPLVVTRADGPFVLEIAGRPALDRLDQLLAAAPEEIRAVVPRALQLGVVVDEHQVDFGPEDFLIRRVLRRERDRGAIALGAAVEVGSTVQFHVRDGVSADEDLRQVLGGRRGAAGLVFTGSGRGMRLFGEPDHDAELIDAVVQDHALAGMSCAGEMGPVGARSFLHSSSASVVLFHEPS